MRTASRGRTALTALRAAAAVEALRGNLGQWNTFYNDYDPLFTWWMGLPYKHADSALVACLVFLRDAVAVANKTPFFANQPRLPPEVVIQPNVLDPRYTGSYDPNYFLGLGIPYARREPADYSAEDRARVRASTAPAPPSSTTSLTLSRSSPCRKTR